MPFSFGRECGDLREELESVQCRVEEQVVAIVIVIVIAIVIGCHCHCHTGEHNVRTERAGGGWEKYKEKQDEDIS